MGSRLDDVAQGADTAGRAIAGLLGYNPGPGIYSRLERAVEAMPANVRVEELPGLLKRYKEGVPGWELKETDFPGLVGDAKVIPRQDLLDRVRERSPVFTHAEVILGGSPTQDVSRWGSRGSDLESFYPGSDAEKLAAGFIRKPRPVYQWNPSALGEGVSHGEPKYGAYGQGGDQYSELLLLQPGVEGNDFGSHWAGGRLTDDAVAHARFDTHGDALRINELQSDLNNYNIKAAKSGKPTLPFPMQDAWMDVLLGRLALETARKGHRAIEIASPRAIADKVVMPIENAEHLYGKVVPGAIERLGRKMGGLVDDTGPLRHAVLSPHFREAMRGYTHLDEIASGLPRNAISGPYGNLLMSFQVPETQRWAMDGLFERLAAHFGPEEAGRKLNELFLHAQRHHAADMAVRLEAKTAPTGGSDVPRRYLMSDEMRKRILTSGIGASLLAPMAMEGEE